MSSSLPRPLGSRGRLITALTVLSLVVGAPAVTADPVAPDGQAGPDGTDPLPADVTSLGEHGDHFAEGADAHGGSYVLEVDPSGDTSLTQAASDEVPVEPLAWEGPAPDPADIPAEWLVPTPAEEIAPSTPDEPMTADTGYLAQFGAGAQ